MQQDWHRVFMQKGYLFRTMNARIFWTTVASMLVLAGCEPPQKCNSKENERRPDSLIIVASRLWESNTYQDYLNPIAAEKSTTIHWVNATELTALDLVSTLPKADGILLTGGADVHPGRYGQPQDTISCGSIDQERDSLESILLHWVDHTHLACLGICRCPPRWNRRKSPRYCSFSCCHPIHRRHQNWRAIFCHFTSSPRGS